MSKLEVDKITPQSGTTLTIGDSGDTVVIDSTSVSGAKLAEPTLVGSSSSAGSILFKEDTDNGTNAVTLKGPAATADVTLTLPAATDTVVGRQTTDTLTNKTINASQLVDASIATGKLADDAVTTDKLANSINSAITANTAKVTNATHSGEVTGATALTIADNIVDEANLKVSNSPTNGYMLTAQSGNTGGLTWAEAPSGSWVLVNTQTVSGTPSAVESGAVFSSTYDTYVVVIRRINFSANGGFMLRLGTSGGYLSSGYKWAGSGVSSGGILTTYSASDSQVDLLGGTGSDFHMNTTQDCLSGVIWVHNPYNSVRTSIHGELAWENATDVDAHINNIAAHPNTGASYDRWKLFPNTGTFQTTTIIQTFGVVNA